MKMSKSHKLTSRARTVLGLFVAMWLNLVLQPCAMAFADAPHQDCPKCPPGHERSMEAMHGQETVLKDMPCASGVADCGIFGEFNYDGRNDQPKVKDYSGDFSLALSLRVFPLPRLNRSFGTQLAQTRHSYPGIPIPFTILHCVYLK